MIKNNFGYTSEVVEFTAYLDYSREKIVGHKRMEVEPGRFEMVEQYKEIITKGLPSKLTVYTADVAKVQQLRNSKLKLYKNRCLIKLRDNDVFVVKGNFTEIKDKIFKNFKAVKIGF